MQLDGKVAIVTGAGTGIGRAILIRFAREGAKVIGTGRTSQTLEDAKRAVEAEGGTAHIVVADASVEESADTVISEAKTAFGGVDILVNNAGVGWMYERVSPGSMAPLADTPPDKWREVMAINIDSAYYMTHAVIPEMRKRGGGAIVNVASVGGLRGMADAHTYSAAKGAMVNLTRSLAITYGPEGIRTNCLAPGFTDTGMITNKLEELGDPFADEAMRYMLSPMGRPGAPDEMANAALFLASDEASYVNGAILAVDGGSNAG